MAKIKELIPSEHDEQVRLIEWCNIWMHKYPELDLIFAIPNGGKRNIIVAKKLKAEGVKSGVPDLFLPVARKYYYGLFIEMKRIKKSQISSNQNEWIQKLTNQGYLVATCYGHLAAEKMILDYLKLK